MKLFRISLVALIAFMLFSCDKGYEEPSGMNFDGLWLLDKTYVYTEGVEEPTDTIIGKRFIVIVNDHKDYDLLEFYTNAVYDSSYFYNLIVNDVVCRKINDLQMKISAWKHPDTGLIINDTTFQVMKPIKPISDEVNETYFATYSFTETNLIFKHYKQTPSSTDKPLQVSYYSRAKK